MRLFNRKSQLQRLLETVDDVLDTPGGIKLGMPGGAGSGRRLKAALSNDRAMKAGLIAGGVAGLAAGSTGISALRRRHEGARYDS